MTISIRPSSIRPSSIRNSFAALSFTAAAVAGLSSPAEATCSSEPYIGSICITAASFCPQDYLEPTGQLVSINQYQALYSLVGRTFGGDGTTVFGLPDLRGRTPVGLGTGPGLTPVQWGQKRGAETQTLSIATLPSHSHAATFAPTTGPASVTIPATPGNLTAAATLKARQANGQGTPQSGYVLGQGGGGTGAANIYVDPATSGTDVDLGGVGVTLSGTAATAATTATVQTVTGGAVTVGDTGDGKPFAIVPPQLGLRYCIAMNGIYPPRPD